MTIQSNTAASASFSTLPTVSPPIAADTSPIARLYNNLEVYEPVYWDHYESELLNHPAQLPDYATRNAIRDQWRVIIDTLIQATNDYHASLRAETFANLHENLSALADQVQKDDAFALEACSQGIKGRLEIVATTLLGDDCGRSPSRSAILQRLSDAMVLFPAVSAPRKVLSTLTYLHVPAPPEMDVPHVVHVGESFGKAGSRYPDTAGSGASDQQTDGPGSSLPRRRSWMQRLLSDSPLIEPGIGSSEHPQSDVHVSPGRSMNSESPYLKLSPFPIRDCLAQHLGLESSPQRVALNMSHIDELAYDCAKREHYDEKDGIYLKDPRRFPLPSIYPSNWDGVSGTQICMIHQRDKNALRRLLDHPYRFYQPASGSLLAVVARRPSVEVYNPKAVHLILEAYPMSYRQMADVKSALRNAMVSGQSASVDVLLDRCYEFYKTTGIQNLDDIYSHALTCQNANELVAKLLAHEQRLKSPDL